MGTGQNCLLPVLYVAPKLSYDCWYHGENEQREDSINRWDGKKYARALRFRFTSREELLQDWNYRLRKPCGNNFEAAKPEEKKMESFVVCAR